MHDLREDIKREALVSGLKGKNASLKKVNEQLRRELRAAEQRFEVALALRDASPKCPPIVAAPGRASESVACVVLSDWHAEETVDARTVNGLNRYNLRIAEKRISAVFANALKLIRHARTATKIDTLVVALLGDFLTGYIHEELVEGNGLSPVETVLWLKPRIAAGLKYLRDQSGCKRIVIPCCVGNHGRTTKLPRVATATKNSYEWLLYKILADEMPGFEWHVADGQLVFLDVLGARWRLQHGDAIKYAGGVGGITIPVNKAIAQWDKNESADFDIFGHWHQFIAQRKFLCNSSLIGFNAWSLFIKAECEPPAQSFFLWHRDQGRTLTCPIFAV